jgi:hypothetical protein
MHKRHIYMQVLVEDADDDDLDDGTDHFGSKRKRGMISSAKKDM